jgi:group I intron endonuclease
MDRKARIRAYKETPRPMGVYRVRNTANGKGLVGSSTDLPARLNRHRAQLSMGAHANRALQKDWNELGPEVFEFEILDTLKPRETAGYDPSDDLRVLEEMWLDKLSPFGERGYNAKPNNPRS